MNLMKFFMHSTDSMKYFELTIELSPSKFLDTQLYLHTGHQKYQSDIRETPFQQIYTEQKIYCLI